MVLTELLPSLHLRAHRLARRLIDPEQADRALLLAEGRAADEEHVVEPLELDGAVDAQVGTRAARQLAGELDVDRDGALLRRRVDADDLAFDDAVAGVDLRALADGQVLGLRFRDPQLGLQTGRVGDTREVGARRHLLADADGNLLEHA